MNIDGDIRSIMYNVLKDMDDRDLARKTMETYLRLLNIGSDIKWTDEMIHEEVDRVLPNE